MIRRVKKGIFKKIITVAVASVAAVGVMCGGSLAASADSHKHTFETEWSKGFKNHYYKATCGCNLAFKTAPHNFVEGVCSECGEVKTEVPHVHTFKSQRTYNTKYHWYPSTCGDKVVMDMQPHGEGSVCVCGYTKGSIPNPNPDDPNPANPDNPVPGVPAPEEPAEPAEIPEGIDASGGYNESLYAEWTANSVEGVTAAYKSENSTQWTNIHSNLIRLSGNKARVDAVGLKKGKYDLKVTFADGKSLTVEQITVTEYDRSGYAHFKTTDTTSAYKDGVGAYNDDGTLKNGALVIYLTDANKNDVSDFVYKNTPNGLVKEDISQYLWQGKKGIGYILNNRGYDSNISRENYGIQKLTFTYGAVAVRIFDNVKAEVSGDASKSLIEGLTAYNSEGNGGSKGDNGRMARITNARNLTIEGIGKDAGMFGWGVHFVSNDNLHKTNYEAGKGFEVRNITFANYPEDAVGMEGTQGSKVDATGSITAGDASATSPLVSPVQRCWIHNNVFYPGYCASPAESDKAEGDGSCDFKRGRYYTLSYNYFENCHKTNLIGSSGSSVTYDVTMHHNWWNNCGARQPLVRRANVHFYNNYISGDMSATPKPALSYISSIRAAAYMFMEGNYYDGCKAVVEDGGEGGGIGAKAYNNIYYACFGGNASTIVTDREQKVANSCKFLSSNIDYSSFDTDPNLFYYDKVNKVSKCLLDTPVNARKRVMMSAGVNGFGKSLEQTKMNSRTPSTSLQLPESGDLNITIGTNTSGIEFNGVKSGKFKGQGIAFNVPTGGAIIKVSTSTKGDPSPELVDSEGKVWAAKFTDSVTTELPEGTYFIASGMKDKECVITSLSFSATTGASAVRVQAAIDAINAIPNDITVNDGEKIKHAQVAFSALNASEVASFDSDLKNKLNNSAVLYDRACAERVINLINAIGTVDKDSFDKINAAENAYNALTATQKAKVTNRDKLDAAKNAFAQYAVTNLTTMIDGLQTVAQIDIGDENTVNALTEKYDATYKIYEDLDENAKSQVPAASVKKLTDGLNALKPLPNLFIFKDELEKLSLETLTLNEGAAIKNLYGLLTAAQKAKLTATENQKYTEIAEKYEAEASQMIQCKFEGAKASDSAFVVTKSSAKTAKLTIKAYNVDLNSGIKLQSDKKTDIKVTLTAKSVLRLYLDTANGTVSVGGTKYTAKNIGGDNVVEITLEAGTYSISKGDKEDGLFYATISPAG